MYGTELVQSHPLADDRPDVTGGNQACRSIQLPAAGVTRTEDGRLAEDQLARGGLEADAREGGQQDETAASIERRDGPGEAGRAAQEIDNDIRLPRPPGRKLDVSEVGRVDRFDLELLAEVSQLVLGTVKAYN